MSPHEKFLKTLSAPHIAKRCAEFKCRVVSHRRLEEVRAELLRRLTCPDDATIVAVCGPTGVGKTTLCSLVADDLRVMYPPSVPGAIPILEMHCPDPDLRGGYSLERKHWAALQRAFGDPFIDSHYCPDDAAARRRSGKEKHTSGRRSSSQDLRRAAENYLKLRHTRFLLVDEAHHIAIVSTDQRATSHMHTLKVFGDTTGVQQALFGTEALLPLLRRGGELTRRAPEIFFDPYLFDRDSDVDAFNQAFCHLSQLLPCDDPSTFEAHLEEVFLGSLGCVGLLKEWLTRALHHALTAGRDAVTYRDLLATATAPERLEEISAGIREFREFVEQSASIDTIRGVVGMKSSSHSKQRTKNAPAAKSLLPGQRGPSRDPVGSLPSP